jgi:hypothetical protein
VLLPIVAATDNSYILSYPMVVNNRSFSRLTAEVRQLCRNCGQKAASSVFKAGVGIVA